MLQPLPSLREILNPRAVAVIGASESTAKFGGRAMNFLVKHGFAGTIIPVNQSARTVLGIPAYPSISAAPRPVDVALLALPRPQLAAAIMECGNAGVRCCVVLTADFAEAGPEGAVHQEQLVQIAHARNMRLIGPNCLGFINPGLKLALTSSVALAIDPMPSGAIGLVSQSGSLMASLISHAQDLGTGFSAAISVGNQADLEICDFIEYFLEDGATRAICAYVEGLKDGRRFLALAKRCRAARKPLLAVKAGTTDAGARITQSHTASLAGSDAVWRAACREHAVVVLDDPESMIQCADFLIRFGAPRGNGVAALSPSGGTIAVTADRIASAGLRLARLAESTRQALYQIVPATRPANPLDVGGLARDKGFDAAQQCFELLASDPDTAVVLIVVATTPQLDDKVRMWSKRALERGKPTAILLVPGTLVDGARDVLREQHCPFTNRMDDALRVIKAAITYGETLRTPYEVPTPPDGFSIAAAFTAENTSVTESEAKALLRGAGIRTTGDRLVRDANAAACAAQDTGYPVALKLSSRTLTHKSDVGGVKLGLANEGAVRSAWREIAASVAHHAPEHELECVVQPMASGGIELFVGTQWDAQFGAVVIVGAGGVWVETLRDTQMALAPVTQQRALELIRRLRIWPLLEGRRGQPEADIERAADAVVRASWVAAKLGPQLSELDINPLLIKPCGEGAIALDARATLAPIGTANKLETT